MDHLFSSEEKQEGEMGLDQMFSSSSEELEGEMGLDQLFSSQDEQPEEQVLFKCLHDREDFDDGDNFFTHNREVHRGYKKSCKICHNAFRDGKKLKADMKKLHKNEEFSCSHDGRSFTKVNGFRLHDSDCHLKFRQVCPDSRCANVFNSSHILKIHND